MAPFSAPESQGSEITLNSFFSITFVSGIFRFCDLHEGIGTSRRTQMDRNSWTFEIEKICFLVFN